jgi:positive regulator of sigma E activity
MVAFDAITNRNDVLPLIFSDDLAAILYTYLSLAEDSSKVFAEAFFLLAFYVILQMAKIREKDSAVPKVGQ